MAECTRTVIGPLYHSKHNDKDRQYDCDRGISSVVKLAVKFHAVGMTSQVFRWGILIPATLYTVSL